VLVSIPRHADRLSEEQREECRRRRRLHQLPTRLQARDHLSTSLDHTLHRLQRVRLREGRDGIPPQLSRTEDLGQVQYLPIGRSLTRSPIKPIGNQASHLLIPRLEVSKHRNMLAVPKHHPILRSPKLSGLSAQARHIRLRIQYCTRNHPLSKRNRKRHRSRRHRSRRHRSERHLHPRRARWLRASGRLDER
jgi:hypothetical protein